MSYMPLQKEQIKGYFYFKRKGKINQIEPEEK
jgi:hypothetical protein